MNDNLTLRRAKFVYEGTRIGAIAQEAPVINPVWEDRDKAFKSQFLEVIEKQCSINRSVNAEELHNSWWKAYIDLGWKYGKVYDPKSKTHPDMLPYWNLDQKERDKDAIFIRLCDIARLFIN